MCCCSSKFLSILVIVTSCLIIASGTSLMIINDFYFDYLNGRLFFSTGGQLILKFINFFISLSIISIGLAGISGICLKKGCFKSFLLFIYIFGNFLAGIIFFFISILLVHLLVSNSLGYKWSDSFCRINIFPLYANSPYNELLINQNKLPPTCTKCPNNGSDLLQECENLKNEGFDHPEIYDDIYLTLKDIESTFSCVGVCPAHSKLKCSYFSKMDSPNPGHNCFDSMQSILVRRMIIIDIIVFSTGIIIILNIIFGLIICCRNSRSKKSKISKYIVEAEVEGPHSQQEIINDPQNFSDKIEANDKLSKDAEMNFVPQIAFNRNSNQNR